MIDLKHFSFLFIEKGVDEKASFQIVVRNENASLQTVVAIKDGKRHESPFKK